MLFRRKAVCCDAGRRGVLLPGGSGPPAVALSAGGRADLAGPPPVFAGIRKNARGCGSRPCPGWKDLACGRERSGLAMAVRQALIRAGYSRVFFAALASY